MLKSEGIVKKHQADVLGVYRMVDSYNDRPVYKQDGGENYIYYRWPDNSCQQNMVDHVTMCNVQLRQQHLVCGHRGRPPVRMAPQLYRECKQQTVRV